MKPTITISITLFVVTVMYGCTESDTSTDNHTVIQNNWSSFENNWNSFNTEGCVSIYTDSAEVIAPEMSTAEGKEAIAEFYNFLFSNNRSAEYKHITESLSIENNQAIEYGTFSVNWVTNDGQPWTFNARVLVHWVKTYDNEWKIQRLLFNSPPEPGAS